MKRTLITESWNDPRLTLLETKTIIPFVSSIEKYITEAQLTPDQISQLFTNVEQGATASGGNRTMVGKGKDAASFINKKINDLGAQLKKAGPVQNADAKFAELKTKIGSKDSKVVKGIQAVSDWAKENPGKASIAVAVLTAAAAMSAGPLGGAVAGFLARATKDLLQGADLSTAAGKAVKGAAIGALAGMALDNIGDAVLDNFAAAGEAEIEGMMDDIIAANLEDAMADIDPELSALFPELEGSTTLRMSGSVNNFYYNYDVVLVGDDLAQYQEYQQSLGNLKVFSDEYYQETAKFHDFMAGVQNDPMQGQYRSALDALSDAREAGGEGGITSDQWDTIIDADEKLIDKLNALSKADDVIAAAVQGGAQQADTLKDKAVKVSAPKEPNQESINFKNIQIETIIEWCDQSPAVILTEGPLDAIKKGASAVGGAIKKGAAAVGAKAAKVGKNITTKVTADKLNSAWKKAGSPTDSDEIAKILRQQGVSDEVLAPVYKQLGAKLPPAPAAADPQAGKPGTTGGQPGTPQAGKPGATGGQTGTPQAGKPGTTGGQTGTPQAGKPGTTGGQAAGAAAPMDFKAIQQAVAKMSSQDAKELVTHIDSLGGNKPAAQPKAAPQGTTAPAQGGQQAAQAPQAEPTAQSGAAPAQGRQQAAQAPQAEPTAQSGAAPAQGGAAPAADKNAAGSDTYEKAKGDIRKVQGGQKPMPPKTAATISSDLAKLAKGDKESGVAAAQKIMQFAKAGVDVSKQQQAWIANSKAGERFLTQSEYFELTKMMREHKLSWSDLGIRVHLLEGTNKMFGISFK